MFKKNNLCKINVMYGIYCLKENKQSKGKTLKNKNKT